MGPVKFLKQGIDLLLHFSLSKHNDKKQKSDNTKAPGNKGNFWEEAL
jgi:hypothetical protein